MEHYTLYEASIELGQKTDYLQKIVLFDGKPIFSFTASEVERVLGISRPTC